jgi:hypothetical protein
MRKDINMDTPITAVKTKLSDIPGGKYWIAKDYLVEFPTGTHLLLVVGQSHEKPGAKFEHPAVLKRENRIHEYKHYRRQGSKFWTARAGVDLVFAVPLNRITALPKKGHSYPYIEIGGEEITLNVSGGGGEVWTEWVRDAASTSCNMPLKKLKAIAGAAIPLGEFKGELPSRDITPEELQREQEQWLGIVASLEVKNRLIKEVDAGKQMKVVLGKGYSFSWGEGSGDEGVATHVMRTGDYVTYPAGYKHKTYPPKGFLVGNTRVKFTQVDWAKTAAANGMDAYGNDLQHAAAQ